MDLSKLNKNITKTVLFLRENGFNTTDSGDGETHDFSCDRNYPYVSMTVNPVKMYEEVHRLVDLLKSKGIELSSVSESFEIPCVQLNYDPINGIAIIDLTGVKDSMLK